MMCTRLLLELQADVLHGTAFLLRNSAEVREFLQAKRSCEACDDTGICPEHLEVATDLWFNNPESP